MDPEKALYAPGIKLKIRPLKSWAAGVAISEEQVRTALQELTDPVTGKDYVSGKEARNIKYADFVTPGKELVVAAEIMKQDDSLTTLKAQGTIDGNVDDANQPLACLDYYRNGYTLDAYLANPTGMETARNASALAQRARMRRDR